LYKKVRNFIQKSKFRDDLTILIVKVR
jgi:serine phosphatase RsbU (regulator of sigma subunit)